jgi:branched-chain amino acid transport system permease protein
MSGKVVLMTLLGGMGTIFWPFGRCGYRRDAAKPDRGLGVHVVTIIMGIIFVICVLLFRRGIVGEIEFRLNRRR